MFVFRLVCILFAMSLFASATDEEEKDVGHQQVIFDSESESALFATVSGIWKQYEFEGQKMIRVTPEPIKQCRVDLGPELASYHVAVTAKVLGQARGHLKPRMGVGIFGEWGYSLRLNTARNLVELVQYGEVIAEAPVKWEPAQWFFIELEMEPQETFWRLTGRVWASGRERPDSPVLSHDAYPSSLTHQLHGRAFLIGSPFNGLPIFFDKVRVETTDEKVPASE